MRRTRLAKIKKRNSRFISILCIFIIIIPVTAYALSVLITNLYNEQSVFGILGKAPGISTDTQTALKYIFDFNDKKLYRLDINKFDEYDKAIKFIDILKGRNLNAFIIKQNGFIVTFGIYSDEESVSKASELLLQYEIEGSINEVVVAAHNSELIVFDEAYMQLLRESNEIISSIIEHKSQLSMEVLEKNNEKAQSMISEVMGKEKNLEDIKNKLYEKIQEASKTASDNSAVQINRFIEFLDLFLEYRLKLDSKNGYYEIQNSLLNQIEAINRLVQIV